MAAAPPTTTAHISTWHYSRHTTRNARACAGPGALMSKSLSFPLFSLLLLLLSSFWLSSSSSRCCCSYVPDHIPILVDHSPRHWHKCMHYFFLRAGLTHTLPCPRLDVPASDAATGRGSIASAGSWSAEGCFCPAGPDSARVRCLDEAGCSGDAIAALLAWSSSVYRQSRAYTALMTTGL